MEICKAIRFWKAYNVRSPKSNVYICAAPLTVVAMATKIWEFQHKSKGIPYLPLILAQIGTYIMHFNGALKHLFDVDRGPIIVVHSSNDVFSWPPTPDCKGVKEGVVRVT